MSAIGVTIKRLRHERGWTQRDLGKRAKLAEVSIARLECGMRTNPPLTTLKKLAKALKVPLADLVKDED
ncbi:MAG: helix-turn-helix transcriptional regulator [Nitrospirota bacterium]